jgi:hypothetical protein
MGGYCVFFLVIFISREGKKREGELGNEAKKEK